MFALLSGRIAVTEKHPQRYGIQLGFRRNSACDLEFECEPMDHRAQVEARRKALNLAPLKVYKRMVLEMRHCPTDLEGQHHTAAPPEPDKAKRG